MESIHSTESGGSEILRVYLSGNLAQWLRAVEALPAAQALATDQRQWRAVWAQQFLQFLAERQREFPGPGDVEAFLLRCESKRTLRYRDQVEEAAAMVLAVAGAAPREFAESLRREGRRHPQENETTDGREQEGSADAGRAGSGALARLRAVMRTRHYSLRTEEAYTHWVRRVWEFSGKRPLGELGAAEVRDFVEHLAVERNVVASTQKAVWHILHEGSLYDSERLFGSPPPGRAVREAAAKNFGRASVSQRAGLIASKD